MFDITKMEMHTMRLSDLDSIKNNLQTDFDEFWNYEIFKEEIGNTNSSYLVVLYNNEIIAFDEYCSQKKYARKWFFLISSK